MHVYLRHLVFFLLFFIVNFVSCCVFVCVENTVAIQSNNFLLLLFGAEIEMFDLVQIFRLNAQHKPHVMDKRPKCLI